MSIVSAELYCRVTKVIPDPSFVTFVGKLQKAKTRKDKGYYVLRTTVPKEVAEKTGSEAGDYLFFKVKKAEWYHMVDWENMQNTWNMLPSEIKQKVALDGVYSPSLSNQLLQNIGATNLFTEPSKMLTAETKQ